MFRFFYNLIFGWRRKDIVFTDEELEQIMDDIQRFGVLPRDK